MTDSIETALMQARTVSGLPLGLDVYDMSILTRQELLTCALLSDPLVVWRGLLCADDQLRGAWILYQADESRLTAEIANTANLLTKMGALVTLPGARSDEYLATRKAETLRSLSTSTSCGANFERTESITRELRLVDRIRLIKNQVDGGGTAFQVGLKLPVLFGCPLERLNEFNKEYQGDLIRLRHALSDVASQAERVDRETVLIEVIRELDYQIEKLNVIFENASKQRWLSGIGVAVGCTITALSLVVPTDLKPFLLAAGSPTTITAGLQWLGGRREATRKCRESDFFIAWRFKVK